MSQNFPDDYVQVPCVVPIKNTAERHENCQALATRDADSFYVQDCRQASVGKPAEQLRKPHGKTHLEDR